MRWKMTAGLMTVILMSAACTRLPSASSIGSLGDRIVSIDYCADQMVLGLVERHRIAAVSVDSASDPLFAGPRAKGKPRIRAELERILALRPTLVVRSYGGGPRIAAMLERAGVKVFTLPYSADLAGVRSAILASGAALDADAAAQRRLLALDTAIAGAATRPETRKSALYMTPGNVTTGSGGLIADILHHAGYRPYLERPGWHRLPVERIVDKAPDIVVRAFFESHSHQQDRWSSSGHRVLDARLGGVPTVTVPGSALACGNWLAGDALTAIAELQP